MAKAERQYTHDKTSLKHSKILDWLAEAEASIPETHWREEALEDYKFYAGKQDTNEVLEALKDQQRPASVFNEIKTKIDMLAGMAAQSEWDIAVLPVGTEDEALAELGSGILKHFRDSINFNAIEHDVFTHTVKSGRSFIYFSINKQNPFRPKVEARRYPGEHVFVDPECLQYDLSDARYVFVEKWLTEEEITRYWSDIKVNELQGGQYYNEKLSFFNEASEKYRLLECWWRKWEKKLWFVDPLSEKEMSLSKEDFARYTQKLREGVSIKGETVKFEQEIPAYQAWVPVIYYTIFSGYYVVEEGISPYNIDAFPIVQCGAYRDDDENRWFSVISQLKDPQRTKNTLTRQLIHLLQTLPKGIFMHEVGAVLNIEEYEERAADPSFHLQLARDGLQRVKFQQQPMVSPLYGQLGDMFSSAMKDISGIQNELMGVQTTSREPGVSIRARQETGIAVLFILFYNYRKTRHQAAKIYFKLLQQYVREPQMIRIKGENGKKLIEINTQLNPQSAGFNDITALEYDLVLDDEIFTASMKAAVAQTLVEYGHNNPGAIPPDLVLEYSGVPFSVKQRIKENYEAQQAAAQEQAEREQARLDAELAIKQGELEIKRAEAGLKAADIQVKREVALKSQQKTESKK